LKWEVVESEFSRFRGVFPFSEPVLVESGFARDWPEYVGVIYLFERGCGVEYLLVINGKERGNIWVGDCDGLAPCGQSFREWYLGWLRKELDTARQTLVLQ